MIFLFKILYFIFIFFGGTYLMQNGLNILLDKNLSYGGVGQISFAIIGVSWFWNLKRDMDNLHGDN